MSEYADMSPVEKELLDAEMSAFTANIVSEEVRQAIAERKARGAEHEEDIDISGQVDGIPYRAVIKADK